MYRSNISFWELAQKILNYPPEQGIPPILLGIMTFLFLPSRPESTTCLSDRERQIAIERMNRDSSGDNGAVVNRGTYSSFHVSCGTYTDPIAHIIAAFRDWRVCVFLMSSCCLK